MYNILLLCIIPCYYIMNYIKHGRSLLIMNEIIYTVTGKFHPGKFHRENFTYGKFHIRKIPTTENSNYGQFPLRKFPAIENSTCKGLYHRNNV